MNPHGDFIWYELSTRDAAASRGFYADVLGWRYETMPGDIPYELASAGGGPVAGLYPIPAGAEMPVAWIGYVGVDDVDRAVAAVIADGGREMMAAQDIPGVGRMAGLVDPQGAAFMVMRGASPEASDAFDPAAIGHCNWNELALPDPAAGLAFYGRHFGWTPGGAMPMGELGEYRFIDHAGRTIGAVMPLQPPRPPSFLFYFGVADIEAATAAVKTGGGTVLAETQPIPGEMFITVALDPQGAAFGLVGPRKG